MPVTTHQSLYQIFAAPFTVAVISIAGLVSALVGDGWWDSLSWVTLGVQVFLYLLLIGQRVGS